MYRELQNYLQIYTCAMTVTEKQKWTQGLARRTHTPSFMTFIILPNFKRSDFFRYGHNIFKFKNIWPISKVTWDEVLTVLLKVSTL